MLSGPEVELESSAVEHGESHEMKFCYAVGEVEAEGLRVSHVLMRFSSLENSLSPS